MPTSQNGFSANDRSVIASYTVPGTNRKVALRKGDTAVILLDLAAWIHAHIEPIDVGEFDDWGYAERNIRGSTTTLSNHASGTALDINAVKHPLGVHGTWTADQKRRINARLAYYEGCIRFGENYSGRVDPMHLEINAGPAACKRVADKIRSTTAAQPSGGFLMSLSDAEQGEALALLRTINTQLTGDTDGSGPDGWGWPSWRYGSGKDLTLVDLLRSIDRETGSAFTLDGRPGGDTDSVVGHVLSLRAEIRALAAELAAALAALSSTTKGN
jgi:D-alanyl-D-alanine carboxypeptidase